VHYIEQSLAILGYAMEDGKVKILALIAVLKIKTMIKRGRGIDF